MSFEPVTTLIVAAPESTTKHNVFRHAVFVETLPIRAVLHLAVAEYPSSIAMWRESSGEFLAADKYFFFDYEACRCQINAKHVTNIG